MKNVVVCGSREFDNYALLKAKLDHFLNKEDDVIIEGGADGADTLAKRYAQENGFQYKEYPADWKRHGKKAGMIRNKQMADIADYGIAFMAIRVKSVGTKNMIECLQKQNKVCITIYEEAYV